MQKPKEVVSKLPLDRILLETDCQYLSPEPFRGTRNDPTRIPEIAKSLAGIKELSLDKVVETTNENLSKLFRL